MPQLVTLKTCDHKINLDSYKNQRQDDEDNPDAARMKVNNRVSCNRDQCIDISLKI
jgi:hypothetical protein